MELFLVGSPDAALRDRVKVVKASTFWDAALTAYPRVWTGAPVWVGGIPARLPDTRPAQFLSAFAEVAPGFGWYQPSEWDETRQAALAGQTYSGWKFYVVRPMGDYGWPSERELWARLPKRWQDDIERGWRESEVERSRNLQGVFDRDEMVLATQEP